MVAPKVATATECGHFLSSLPNALLTAEKWSCTLEVEIKATEHRRTPTPKAFASAALRAKLSAAQSLDQ
jgi:hypothetical protein